jgi:hypothetical protein
MTLVAADQVADAASSLRPDAAIVTDHADASDGVLALFAVALAFKALSVREAAARTFGC